MGLILRFLAMLVCSVAMLSGARAEETEMSFSQISVNGHPAYIIPETAAAGEWKRWGWGGAGYPGLTGYWTPTPQQIEAADKVIRRTLRKAIKNPGLAMPYVAEHPEKFAPHALENWVVEIRKINQHIDSYQAQYLGLIVRGKKQIVANYFDLAELRKDFPNGELHDPRKKLVEVADGGYSFWHLQYDLETKSFINFEIDGPWESDRKQ